MTINGGVTFTVHGPLMVDADNTTWHSGAGVFVWDYPALMPPALTLINVREFGADPDDAGDDTAAILAAIATIPAIPTQGGAGCLYFPLPRTVGGFYKVSSTLNFTGKFNSCMIAPGKYSRDQQDGSIAHTALIHWYGATSQNVILLHNTQGMLLTNISVNCRDIAGTRGIALGADATTPSSLKLIQGSGLEVSHCDVGIRFGDLAANGPDVASNTFDDVYVHHNASIGIAQNSGNGVLNMTNLLSECNGTAPTGGKKGANVYAEGGAMVLYGYIGTGEGSCRPADADIYGASVGIKIYDGWSEVHRPAIINAGSPLQPSTISGFHHYNSTMTDTLVPKSVVWAASSPLVIDGFFFSNIEVNAGANSLVMDHGVSFYAGAQHDLSVVPTFTGTAISGQFAYVGFPGTAQRARVAIGKPPRTDIGSTFSEAPALEMTGHEAVPMVALCTIDVNGNNCNTIGVQRGGDSVGAWHFLGNGRIDASGNIKALVAGNMSRFWFEGGTIAGTQPILQAAFDVASAGDITGNVTKFVPGTIFFEVKYVNVGSGIVPVQRIGDNHILWASAAPTSGTWVRGDVTYNLAAAIGAPPAWICTAAGTPGTWRPLANVP